MDLSACLGEGETLTLVPLERRLVPTGLRLAIPSNMKARCGHARLGAQRRRDEANGPGTIDSDYRGDVSVILINPSAQPVQIHHGDRIAQLVICPWFGHIPSKCPRWMTPRAAQVASATGRS